MLKNATYSAFMGDAPRGYGPVTYIPRKRPSR